MAVWVPHLFNGLEESPLVPIIRIISCLHSASSKKAADCGPFYSQSAGCRRFAELSRTNLEFDLTPPGAEPDCMGPAGTTELNTLLLARAMPAFARSERILRSSWA